MLHTQLPPLNALKAFDAVVRHGSVSEAARTLCVSQSAVSRHLKVLEDNVGCRLLYRNRGGVRLTEDGEAYFEKVSESLTAIMTATSQLRAKRAGVQVLRVSSLSSFALRWLVPRIHDFQGAHPGLALEISISDARPEFSLSSIDCAIVSAEVAEMKNGDMPLFPELLIPVCAPALLRGTPVRSPGSLLEFPLIHTSTRSELWQKWSDFHRLPEPRLSAPGLAFQDFYISIAAAVAGRGVALVPSFLVQDELASGDLARPVDLDLASGRQYLLALSPWSPRAHAADDFRLWLKSQN
jgi:LysR family glycine cleavage system transcriptional activator